MNETRDEAQAREWLETRAWRLGLLPEERAAEAASLAALLAEARAAGRAEERARIEDGPFIAAGCKCVGCVILRKVRAAIRRKTRAR
jgi:hypothetical protein